MYKKNMDHCKMSQGRNVPAPVVHFKYKSYTSASLTFIILSWTWFTGNFDPCCTTKLTPVIQ